MTEPTPIEPIVHGELVRLYLGRTEGDREKAAALLALDLMTPDPAEQKAGYTVENAVIAAEEVFPGIDVEALSTALRTAFAPKNPHALTPYEATLIRKWEAGEASEEERLQVQKIGRVLASKQRLVIDEIEGVIETLRERPPLPATLGRIEALETALDPYRETMEALRNLGAPKEVADGDQADEQ